ncbi:MULTISPECIES: NAD-dependent epimerase/dehydratase family protein [unclassified Burkholderia]|uniref:NAD-dependent epimerase/dehydratase family protein n=1 Tax=unclassified Burkholderia TaxID=2613784 RepID=UPI001423EE85|nr:MULTISPECIES: NAD-dependent epimerase/dehydratase family protein [unclassified Burkholderia]NIE83741.1 NAD-dependent epimerase/dehydratase family protein [Burkholderia sp. Tr-860]NIF62350.1 NAD-dependent epimerase/dehydratase family protein [Burkholderia sp. Cy-647]NIF96319.1 NAD-dependent epimerase/dehydratase family protein [Burkholderia sp. Ax-1720]
MAKILITGIAGFTGRHLARELMEQGHEVCGLAHRQLADTPWPVRVCDLLDADALTGLMRETRPDIVMHLAAIAFVAHGDVGEIYKTNVVGTRNLLAAIDGAQIRPKSVLLASSANVYGNAEAELIDESVATSPANDYAVSKLAMEYAARLWFDKLPIVITRPFNYTGAGQHENFLIPKIVAAFRRRLPVLELGNLHVVRDFSDVRMVARAYSRLVAGGFEGEVYNVCSGVGHSLNDILEMMVELTGHRPEIQVNPAFVRKNEVHRLVGSHARLTKAIGPIEALPILETLRWMLDDQGGGGSVAA